MITGLAEELIAEYTGVSKTAVDVKFPLKHLFPPQKRRRRQENGMLLRFYVCN